MLTHAVLEHTRLFSYLCLYELIEASYALQFHYLDDTDEQTEGQRVGTAEAVGVGSLDPGCFPSLHKDAVSS